MNEQETLENRLNLIDQDHCAGTQKYQPTSKTRWLTIINRKLLGTSVKTMTDLIFIAYKIVDQLADNHIVLTGRSFRDMYIMGANFEGSRTENLMILDTFSESYNEFKKGNVMVNNDSVRIFYDLLVDLSLSVNVANKRCKATRWFSIYQCKDLQLFASIMDGNRCKSIIGEKLLGMIRSITLHPKRPIDQNDNDGKNYKNVSSSLKPTQDS